MTVANQGATPSLVIKINKRSAAFGRQWKFYVIPLVQGMLWRLNAYGIVFKVMLLTLGSLVFLYVHWISRNVVSTVGNQDVSRQ